MNALGWIISAALVLVAVFAVANMSLLTAPASLNFLLFSVEGPFGLILFGAIVVFAALFAVYALSLRASALLETRRHLKEMEVQRQLAEKAEASRLAALTSEVGQEFARVRAALDELRGEHQRRSGALQQSLTRHIDEVSNALFANVGQIDDKLSRIVERDRGPSGGN